ncbi:Poly polymerase pla1 [Golovinomyces cichoracearum]|uniref:Poly(A) polymerase n=1 Tax=Golovinomyces cichoracearum TaxID=62708 RepID=A0A420H9G6_9PEZI|nr:Poly polymerase pla1 [Golovinomyces cichoracearum]
MAAPGVKSFGVTAPLSVTPPTESENQASSALIEELKRQNNYENAIETANRQKVLNSLQLITEEFVRQVSRAQGLPANLIKSAGGMVVTFGSYKLGVIGPGSDIDTLIVAPQNVTKEDFFSRFPDLLRSMATEGNITELTAKPDAFAPCITLKYAGIDIDLLFGRVKLSQVPRNLSLLNQNMLRGLNNEEVRSLNGVRVADEILNLVPEPAIFRTALRTIKLWGTRRAIAGNIYGFPGGVTWAILVARICQLYPKATSSTIVFKFFRIMEKWRWPMPVLLKEIDNLNALGLKVWNPKIYGSDKNHIMPIITPAYPEMCTTHNFSLSTKAILEKELKRGGDITDRVMSGKASWKDLFAKHTFFTNGYKYYLSVVSASRNKESQLFWSGFVESKVRLLVNKLEYHPSIALAHPFNKGFTRVHRCRTEEEVDLVKNGSLKFHATDIATLTTGHGLSVETTSKEKLNETKNVEQDENLIMVYTATHYIGLELAKGAKSLDLSYEVEEFKSICTSSEAYNQEENSLGVAHTKNCDLPDDVFTEGELKPTRPLKQKKKRPATEDSNPVPSKRQQTSLIAVG